MNDPTITHRQAPMRRRWMLTLWLLPTVGCSWTLPSLTPRLPWSARPAEVETIEEEGRVAAKPHPIFQTAAFRMHAQEDAELLLNNADVNLDAANEIATQASTIPAPILPEPTMESSDTLPAPIASDQTDGMVMAATPQMIDLASALGMAGGNAWTIRLARQRTVEAHADLKTAKALWLPTLQFGVGWNKHEGRIQATPGDVIETSRNSFFVGGGATLGEAPVAGGSGGPFRLFADLELADAFFEPKIATRQLYARRAGVSVAKNRALLDAGLAYVDLMEAAGQVADSQAALDAAGELLKLTQTFADAGAGAQADVDRAATQKTRLSRQVQNAMRLHRTRSANLSRRLRLDPRNELQVADQVMVPIELSADDSDLNTLISTANSRRPEINEASQEIAALCLEVRKAEVEPWLPSVAVATSGGTFGGGMGSSFDNRAGRSDIDLQAVWQLDSLGLGVAANRKRASSQLAQRQTALADLRDQIASDVVQAYEDVLNYRTQIDIANEAVALATSSYERNLQRVRADEGLPIELLQAIAAQADGLRDRTAAVANYNRAQLRLLYATGQLSY